MNVILKQLHNGLMNSGNLELPLDFQALLVIPAGGSWRE